MVNADVVEAVVRALDDFVEFVTKSDRYERIVDKLYRLLLQTWNERSRAAIQEAIATFELSDDTFSAEDADAVLDALENELGISFGEDVASEVGMIQKEVYSIATKDAVTGYSFGQTDRRTLRWLQQDSVYWIGTYYERELQDTLRTEIGTVVVRGMSRMNAGKYLQSKLGTEFDRANTYWEGLSNHIVTRTREFGKVNAYKKGGIRFIEIRAVLDSRTSKVCRYMHGRIFSVEDAQKVQRNIMNAKTPDEVKKKAPWLDGGKVQRMTTLELADKGVILPPYHWHCRSTTVMWDMEGAEIINETELGENLSQNSRRMLGVYTKEEYSNWLYDFRVGQENLQYDAGDLKQDMIDHAPLFGITNEDEYIALAKAIVAKANDVLVQVWKDGELQFIFFGDRGIVVVDTQFFIRGCFPHLKDGGIQKAFEAFRRKSLWLKQKKRKKY